MTGRHLSLKEKTLTEMDYKQLMLDEYTFLKRPFILIDGEAFVGNAKKTIEAAKLKIKTVDTTWFGFGYDQSKLQEKEWFLLKILVEL